jgi:hypothetical protein
LHEKQLLLMISFLYLQELLLKTKEFSWYSTELLIILPAPIDIPSPKGIHPDTGAELERKASDAEPFSALAFKVATDPFVGQLIFFRVYSGTLEVWIIYS